MCRYLILLMISFVGFQHLSAQPWKLSEDETTNYFEITAAFNNYWENKEIERGNGYKQFKRWEWFWQHRVKEDGSFYPAGINQENFADYLRLNKKSNRNVQANWQSLGPDFSLGGYAGIGRINALAFHPTDPKIIYAGAPAGGLWVSNDGGNTWNTATDGLNSIGVSAIVIHPTNPNIIYIATGDGDAADTYSTGVLKSVNGGLTFSATGLDWTQVNNRRIRRMLMDSDNPDLLVVASTNGIYRTTNAGNTWTQVQTGNFYDVEAKPGTNQTTWYASTSSAIFRSTNEGLSWTSMYSITGSNRINLTVTAANPNYVYFISSLSSDSGFKGLYRSTDSGTTFTLRSSTPNILTYSSTGSGTGGQGWYDLALIADPANAETIYVGGINTWKSTNGGTNWTLRSHWSGASSVQTVHADKHVLEFQGTVLWEGNDGGIYRSPDGGVKWEHKSNSLRISQMYRIGVSQTSAHIIAGLQDNGTKLRNPGGNWTDELGGDGMDCAIKPNDVNVMYGCIQNGELRRSINAGANWTNIKNNISSSLTGAWITPYRLNPQNPSNIIAGYDAIYSSNNQGDTWTNIGTTAQVGTAKKTILEIAPSNPNYIYAGTSSAMWRTTDGGTTWASINVPGSSTVSLCIHPTDPNTLWATRSNYTAGSKVYKSTNGGSTWTNISGTLPNLPANTVIYQNNTQNGIYVGMDIGVFYKDDSMPNWELFFDGLPNVVISELEIDYTNGWLYAATYGRGLWKTEIATSVPVCLYPVNIKVDELSTYQAKISWDINTGSYFGFQYLLNNSSTQPSANGIPTTDFEATFSGLTPATDYYFHIRTICNAGSSYWITQGPFRTSPACGQSFFDSGGSGSNYGNLESRIWTLCPTNECNNIRVSFTSFNVEPNWDALYIFDGPNISSQQFSSGNPITSGGFPAGGFYGTTPPGTFISTHATGCLTFRFLSDDADTRAGWASNVSCIFKDPLVTNTNDAGPGSLRNGIDCLPSNGVVSFSPALSGQTIQLTSAPLYVNRNLNMLQTPGNVINIEGSNNYSIFDVQKGIQLNLRNISLYPGIGNGNLGRAILNGGFLTLEDTQIFEPIQNLGSGSSIQNYGEINVIGNSSIKGY
jgi:photosystem II stability/assembly factor-like uncharacterized protein